MGAHQEPPPGGGTGRSSSSQDSSSTQGNDGGAGRNQAVLVAVIAAVATIAAALIGLIKQDVPQPVPTPRPSPSTSKSSGGLGPNSFNPTNAISIEMNLVRFARNGENHFVLVTGHVGEFPLPPDMAVYAFAAPANGEPVQPGAIKADRKNSGIRQSSLRNFYSSDAVPIGLDGRWEARIELEPTETRDLTVHAAVMYLCDFSPSDDPECGIPADKAPPPKSAEPTVGAPPPLSSGERSGGAPAATARQSVEDLGPQSPSIRAISGATTVTTHP